MSDATRSGPRISLAAERFHDLLCDELEAGWKAGAPPRIEDLLLRVDETERPDLLAALLPVERDCRPPSPDVDDRRRFPDYLAVIEELDRDVEPRLPTIPGHEVLEVIGTGSMGIVLRARDLSLDRAVAIKILKAGAWCGSDEMKRFRREARAVSAIDHPGVVRLFGYGEVDGVPYYAMELVEGGSLKDRLDGQPCDPAWSFWLVERLARTVQHIHDRGVVHRDLKPANILLGPPASDPTPKVADFGLAKRFGGDDASLTRSLAVLGTPCYMAPEQAAGRVRDIGPPADVHALGAILYELVTGRPPYRAETYEATVEQVLRSEPLAPSERVPTIARDVDAVCLRCLEKDPARRYGSARELADDLERLRRETRPETPPVDDRDRHARHAVRLGCEGLEFLSRTEWASLYSAVRPAIGHKVLLKFAHGRVGTPAHAALHRQAMLLRDIDHPNVLRMLDYSEAHGQPCAVFEHVPGGRTLARLPEPPTARRIAEAMLMVALGVAEVHQRGIVHGGLQRGNVLLGKSDAPKLTGFDAARRPGDPPTKADGMPADHVAPEVRRGEPTSVASDLHAFGAMLDELLAEAAVPREESPELWSLGRACRAPDPAQRPASIADVAEVLRWFLSPEGSGGNDKTFGPSEERAPATGPCRRFRLRVVEGPQRQGETIDLPRRRTRIGRHRDNDVVLFAVNMSKQHCDIVWNEEQSRHELIDTGSRNGTRVNDQRVTVSRTLRDGDVVRLPEFVLRYEAIPDS